MSPLELLEVALKLSPVNSTNEVDIQRLVSAFLQPERRNEAALSTQIKEYSRGRKEWYWKAEEAYSVGALHLAARFGLCNNLRSLLASKDRISTDINQRT